MVTNKLAVEVSPDLQAQNKYARKLRESGFNFNLVVADAFIRGIRDIGYKSTATALYELNDNALQAGAENIHVILGFEKTDKKPSKIAVIDDGHGMEPDMIRAAVIWGGTHRENDRKGFGRYGYGLPSASVSQGRRFTVYSIVEGGEFHSVTIDVDEIGAGAYSANDGKIVVPEARPAEIPDWVSTYLEGELGDKPLTHGTVVVIEKLDRLTWKTTDALTRHLKKYFGVTYRNILRSTNIFVEKDRVEAIDPLFLIPGARYFDLDDDRAEALPPLEIKVKNQGTKEVAGVIQVRYAYLPPTFQLEKSDKKRGKWNSRFEIMKENNGIIVLRNGRQIDVLTRCPWLTFVNYDRNWKVELNFPPPLDEEFSITTSKQQIVPTDRIWELLRENGVDKAISGLRKRVYEAFAENRAKVKANEKRASEKAMQEAEKYKTRRSTEDSVEKARRSRETLKQVAAKKAKETNLPAEEIEQQMQEEAKVLPYKVETESHQGAPFFRVSQIGGQKVLYINSAHRFYTDLYAGPDSTARLRNALEVLLFVIGDCELDSSDDRRRFYEMERSEWSRMLSITLDLLNNMDSVEDELSAKDAVAEDTQGQNAPVIQ